jgi:hypothetical protein
VGRGAWVESDARASSLLLSLFCVCPLQRSASLEATE